MQRIDRIGAGQAAGTAVAYGPVFGDLTFEPQDNPGGLYSIRFLPLVAIASMATPDGAITLKAGYRWYEGYGTEATKGFEEEQETDDNGPLWTVSIDGFLPGDSAERRQLLTALVRYQFVVECEDNAGLRRRAGSLGEPMSLRYRFRTGKAMAERRGADLTFQGRLTRACPVLV